MNSTLNAKLEALRSELEAQQVTEAKLTPETAWQEVEGMVDDAEQYDGYSGRGMFGKESPLAFTTSVRPGTPLGKKLQSMGFSVDNMGMEWVYYARNSSSLRTPAEPEEPEEESVRPVRREPLSEVSAKTVAKWRSDYEKDQSDTGKGKNEKARKLLREAEKHLKEAITTFKALAKAEPGLKDIIETYTIPHLNDWVSGQTSGSVRMLWTDLRDAEKADEEEPANPMDLVRAIRMGIDFTAD